MGLFWTKPVGAEVEPPAWLKSVKSELSDTLYKQLGISCAATALLATGQNVVKGTKHSVNEPNSVLIFTCGGVLVGCTLLAYRILETYENVTTNPMRKRTNRAALGLYKVGVTTMPLVVLAAIFIPPRFVWPSFGVAGGLALGNAVFFAVSEPVGLPTAITAATDSPVSASPIENAATAAAYLQEMLISDPSLLGEMPERVLFFRGLQWLIGQGKGKSKVQGGVADEGQGLWGAVVNLNEILLFTPKLYGEMPDRASFLSGLSWLLSRQGKSKGKGIVIREVESDANVAKGKGIVAKEVESDANVGKGKGVHVVEICEGQDKVDIGPVTGRVELPQSEILAIEVDNLVQQHAIDIHEGQEEEFHDA